MTGLELVANGDYLMTGPLQMADTYNCLNLRVIPTRDPFSLFKAGIWVRRSSMGYPIVSRFIELAKEYITGN